MFYNFTLSQGPKRRAYCLTAWLAPKISNSYQAYPNSCQVTTPSMSFTMGASFNISFQKRCGKFKLNSFWKARNHSPKDERFNDSPQLQSTLSTIPHLLSNGSALDLQLLQLTVVRRIKTPQTVAHLLEKMATAATSWSRY